MSRSGQPCRAARLALALLAVIVGGCASHRTPAPVTAPTPIDLETSRARLIERGSRTRLFDGEIRLSGQHRKARFRARALASVAPGGRLWIESSRPLAFVLASDGDELRVLLSAERQWLRLPASARSTEALVGLPLAPDELGAVLAGAGLPPEGLRQANPLGGTRLQVGEDWIAVGPGGDRAVAGSVRGVSFAEVDEGRAIEFRYPGQQLVLKARLLPDDAVAAAPEVRYRIEPPPGFVEVGLGAGNGPLLLPGEE